MIEKTVKIYKLNDDNQRLSDLRYWLSRPPEERVSAVEILRKQIHGNSERLQRTVVIIKQPRS
jgi:hypothetical protein